MTDCLNFYKFTINFEIGLSLDQNENINIFEWPTNNYHPPFLHKSHILIGYF